MTFIVSLVIIVIVIAFLMTPLLIIPSKLPQETIDKSEGLAPLTIEFISSLRYPVYIKAAIALGAFIYAALFLFIIGSGFLCAWGNAFLDQGNLGDFISLWLETVIVILQS